jgi:aminopeptidase N
MKPTVSIILLLNFIFLASCSTSRKAATESPVANAEPEVTIPEPVNYRGSATIMHNLIHTKLDVSFDWASRVLLGEAEITLKPHFYTTNQLFLDARGMDINEVKIFKGNVKEELAYEYRNDSICITLDKYYTKADTFKVFINYVAKPESLPIGGSSAITSDKGLYFINADGSDPNKPMQVWTQGETQSSSVWFPTIDRPNQKTTQEIYITVDTSFVTLSNGKLISSIVNNQNGTRTDYWRQTIPHVPYLFMMAIGNYAVVKDYWKGIEVSYYVEPEFEPYARGIFAHTPEMLEFFSKKLGVDYPWEKYAQVVVRDFVSGAMENTTATIYGEFVQKDDRALHDSHNDDIVAHELFHHWFGNLVTCESWSNLALNESFATYGEYMWNEYKYGADEADWNLQNDLRSYLQEARNKQVNLIRFEYDNQDDMFDRHSYQKGGRILHMLRNYTGDEAFYAAFKLYLNDQRFKAAEVHHLRLAFEEVTGEDMNWFFNQWFLDKGHPSLKIDYEYNAESNTQLVKVQQMQSFETTPLYKLPVDIDIYTSSGVQRKRVIVNRQSEVFEFKVNEKPALVNFDAAKMLTCTKTDNHTADEWVTMFKRAPKYMDRFEAMSVITKDYKAGTPEGEVMMSAFDDPHWNIRTMAIKNCNTLIGVDRDGIRNKLMQLAKTDPKPSVRADALAKLTEQYAQEPGVDELMRGAVADKSYRVMETAVTHLLEHSREDALKLVAGLENEKNENIRNMISGFYVKYGSDVQFAFMTDAMNSSTGFGKYTAVQTYGKFLLRCSPANITTGMNNIADVGFNHPQWFVRLSATQTLAEISKSYGKDNPSLPVAETDQVKTAATELMNKIKEKESDPQLLRIYNRGN